MPLLVTSEAVGGLWIVEWTGIQQPKRKDFSESGVVLLWSLSSEQHVKQR